MNASAALRRPPPPSAALRRLYAIAAILGSGPPAATSSAGPRYVLTLSSPWLDLRVALLVSYDHGGGIALDAVGPRGGGHAAQAGLCRAAGWQPPLQHGEAGSHIVCRGAAEQGLQGPMLLSQGGKLERLVAAQCLRGGEL
jgi:hypothetical protein